MPPVSIAPAYDDPTSGWALVESTIVDKSTRPAAGGTCELELEQLGPTEQWFIDRAVITNTAPGTSCRWYEDTPDFRNILTGSNKGSFDEGDWPAGLLIAPGVSLVVQWVDVDDGGVGTVKLQVRKYRRRTR